MLVYRLFREVSSIHHDSDVLMSGGNFTKQSVD